VFQIIFNEISAAEISRLDTLLQLELLDEFRVTPRDLESPDGVRFGRLERDGHHLYRYRASDYRIYFEVTTGGVLVHRVLHKNTFRDFLYRSNLPTSEDEQLSQSRSFWKLIEEGQNAKRLP
jgi:mRNA-degrading endonuclease RelE of RelBE toxin-antitoxin system